MENLYIKIFDVIFFEILYNSLNNYLNVFYFKRFFILFYKYRILDEFYYIFECIDL